MSVKSHLTLEASLRPENAVKYSAGGGGQNICGVFSGPVPLLRSSTPSLDGHTSGRPFFLQRTRMRIVHTQVLDKDRSSRCDAPYAIAVRSPCVLALQ